MIVGYSIIKYEYSRHGPSPQRLNHVGASDCSKCME
jgi:hypothetical protein